MYNTEPWFILLPIEKHEYVEQEIKKFLSAFFEITFVNGTAEQKYTTINEWFTTAFNNMSENKIPIVFIKSIYAEMIRVAMEERGTPVIYDDMSKALQEIVWLEYTTLDLTVIKNLVDISRLMPVPENQTSRMGALALLNAFTQVTLSYHSKIEAHAAWTVSFGVVFFSIFMDKLIKTMKARDMRAESPSNSIKYLKKIPLPRGNFPIHVRRKLEQIFADMGGRISGLQMMYLQDRFKQYMTPRQIKTYFKNLRAKAKKCSIAKQEAEELPATSSLEILDFRRRSA
ncbi:hypothetical protein GCK72_016892 [Caenorhabditis remanei]|uniref:Uncharacterized protein n=1 Tax=Caenorhabditis remanei TaxID=31234 RepID=A0A6A5G6B6_CAERE|nr:hypothetical protein GCK72_016892 [Caenorhabditis remanei]KAF1750343.1 hypothetical protein GCK72_016892 [Caenorhabditis remanei]